MFKIELLRSQRFILGALICAHAFYALLNKDFAIGASGLLLALILFTTHHYLALDFAGGFQGKFTRLFGFFSPGKWEKLPLINHIVLKHFSALISGEISDSGVYQTSKNQHYIALLSVLHSKQGIIVLEDTDLNTARSKAKEISFAAKLELRDFTS